MVISESKLVISESLRLESRALFSSYPLLSLWVAHDYWIGLWQAGSKLLCEKWVKQPRIPQSCAPTGAVILRRARDASCSMQGSSSPSEKRATPPRGSMTTAMGRTLRAPCQAVRGLQQGASEELVTQPTALGKLLTQPCTPWPAAQGMQLAVI